MKYILFITLLGCSKEFPKPDVDKLSDKSRERVCTMEQLELVEKEFNICNKSSYLSSFCFDMAKYTHCSERNK